MTQSTDFDSEIIRTLAGILDDTKLTEIEYAVGDRRIRVVRNPPPVQMMSGGFGPALAPAGGTVEQTTAGADDLSAHPGAMKSPMVGTAYLAPQPGAAPFVRVGDAVSAGQTILIIEAMKVMNQIKADRGGKLSRLLVSDGAPVEFGQVVAVIE